MLIMLETEGWGGLEKRGSDMWEGLGRLGLGIYRLRHFHTSNTIQHHPTNLMMIGGALPASLSAKLKPKRCLASAS